MDIKPPLTREEVAERARLNPPPPPAKVVLITARSPNGVIGMEGNLPWMIREDLQHFKRVTTGKALIVGSRTYRSMPAIVWQTRIAHVLSRNWQALEVHGNEHHFASCLAGLVNSARHNYAAPGEVYIGGGAEVYALALQLGLVDEMLISEIHQNYIGDVFFPPVPEGMFDAGTVEAEYPEFNVVRYRRLVAN
ncbi:Dihydrofolate reductase [compost metagenome]